MCVFRDMDPPLRRTIGSVGNVSPFEERCFESGAAGSAAVNSGGGHDPDAAVGGAVSAV